jgi:Flp pilus assembly pilin Flp
MPRWYDWLRGRQALAARGLALLGHTRGASTVEYVTIVGAVALVAASAFGDFDAAVRAALTKEPERTARLDGDDGQRNGPTADEMALALLFANASNVSGPGGLRGGSGPRAPIGGVNRGPPRPDQGDSNSGGGTTNGNGNGNGNGNSNGNGTGTGTGTGINNGTGTGTNNGNGTGTGTGTGTGNPNPSNPSPGACAKKGGCTGENGSKCFVAGTLVLTAMGPMPIEEIRVGDEVLSADVDAEED